MTTAKKADGFRDVSAKGLEDYALAVLDASTLLGEAAKSAAQGETAHAFSFERPVDLPRTDAAKALQSELAGQGFTVEWNKRPVIAGGMEKTAWTLIVRW